MPNGHHRPGDPADLLDVRGRAARHLIGPEDQLLRDLPPIAMAIIDLYLVLVTLSWSRSGRLENQTNAERPRGMIVACGSGRAAGH